MMLCRERLAICSFFFNTNPVRMALLGFVEKLYSRIQFLRKKPSAQEKKPQRHKGHKEKAKRMS
jgi:hypothetical protein